MPSGAYAIVYSPSVLAVLPIHYIPSSDLGLAVSSGRTSFAPSDSADRPLVTSDLGY